MEFKVWFDEVELTELIKVIDVRRSVLPARTNTSTNIPNKHGEYFTGYQYGARIVEVDFLIIEDDLNNLQAIKKALAFMLDIDRPTQLKFSDEPNKYLLAVVDGQTDVGEVLHDGKGTITFVCHDPYYYSDNEKIFNGDTTSKMVIQNLGTVETAPTFELDFTDDCGFIAVASPDGVIQIGNPKDIDTVSLPKQERLLNIPMTTLTGWTMNSIDSKIKTGGATVQGSTALRGDPAYGIRPSSFGTPTSGWSGSSIRRNLPASTDTTGVAQYFEMTSIFEFKSTKAGTVTTSTTQRQIDSTQKGILEISITDESNSYLAGIRFKDSTMNSDLTIPEFWVGNVCVWREEPKAPTPKKVKDTYKEKGKVKTVYRTVYANDVGKWNDFYGSVSIKKYDDKIVFDLQKKEKVKGKWKVIQRKTYTYRLNSTMKAKKAKTIQGWFGRYASEPSIDTMTITDIKFNKLNTATRIDLENTFQAGDNLVIDCDASQVFLNGILFMEELDIGSEFFEVVAGQTEIKLIHSSFSNKPTFKATITEKYL